MRIVINYRNILFVLLSIGVVLSSSCNTSKKVPYFTTISDSVEKSTRIPHSQYIEPIIAPNDILQVYVQTIDPKTNSVFSQSGPTETVGVQKTTGYLVDEDGNIELPIVGRVKVSGLTTTAAKNLIRGKAKTFYKEPVVNVRFANFYVTVLGEVNLPGRYIVTNEKVSVIDALGMAGDMSIYGKRENVLLIREENGEKVFVRFNLNSTDCFKSPYYYLSSGDVLYIEPNKAKARTATTDLTKDRYFTLTASALSLVVSIILITR